ncbi:GntR family transcriptional regulator [bacterium]|nr:GntR family transcriptional regulator [bacterium]
MKKQTKVQSKFEQVYDYIINKINKNMSVGDKFLTETEVADLLCVNRMTVAKAMSVLKSEGYIDRKQGMGTIIIKKPKQNVRDGIITVLPYVNIESLKDEYFSKLLNTISLESLNMGLVNTYVGSKGEKQKIIDFEQIDNLYSSEKYQGTVIMNPRKQGVNEWENYFGAQKIIVVWVGMSTDVSNRINCIDADNKEGSINATRYLFELGYRKLGFLSGKMDITNREDRLYGFEKAYEEKKFNLNRNQIVIIKNAKSSKEAGYIGMKRFLENDIKLDALFVADQGLLYGIEEARKEYPNKSVFSLPIITFDYELPGQFSNVIASVIQPISEMGKLAVKIINQIHKGNIKQPVKRLLKVELVKRSGVE